MPNSIYSPSPQNQSYSGAISSTIVTGTVYAASASLNGLSSSDFTPISKLPICEIKMSNTNVSLVFNVSDNGNDVKLEFAPEPDMTVSELMKITMMTTVANCGRLSSTEALEYVRAHSLERHFNFKA